LILLAQTPSGRNVNYDEKQLYGEKNGVDPSICAGFVNMCPAVFLPYIF
jgi:hypothetical protein